MARAYMEDEIRKILKDNELILLSEYKNSTTKMKLKCSCGKIFEKTFKVLNKSKKFMCNDCIQRENTSKKIMPYEVLKKEIESIGYFLLTKKEDYKNASSKCLIKCSEGHMYEQIPLDLLKGHKCKKCATKEVMNKLRTTKEEILKIMEDKNLELLSDKYINGTTPIKVRCKTCNKIFYPNLHNLKKGSGCPHCYNEKKKQLIIPYEQRKEYVESFGFKILISKEKYINANQKIDIQCPKGHIYKGKIHDFVTGNRCPICKESKGEAKIKRVLDDNDVNYIREHKFKDCRYKKELPFDFYLPDYNCCIEFDGKQHFVSSNFFGGNKEFRERKIRDDIKTNYCKENNIKLIRIPYWEIDNIEKIIKIW